MLLHHSYHRHHQRNEKSLTKYDDDEHQTMNMLLLVCRFELIINVPLKRNNIAVSEVKQNRRQEGIDGYVLA